MPWTLNAIGYKVKKRSNGRKLKTLKEVNSSKNSKTAYNSTQHISVFSDEGNILTQEEKVFLQYPTT